jgi:hypothetical protein
MLQHDSAGLVRMNLRSSDGSDLGKSARGKGKDEHHARCFVFDLKVYPTSRISRFLR